MKRIATFASAALVLLASGCRKNPARSSVAPPLSLEGIVRFRPPADGLLTEAQIDRYIRVRRAARGRTDVEAARAVGADPIEYAWVRARVIEALVALDTRRMRSASEETYAKTIAALRQAHQGLHDRNNQRTLEEQIAALERERATLKQIDAPREIGLNAERVAPRRAEIEALRP